MIVEKIGGNWIWEIRDDKENREYRKTGTLRMKGGLNCTQNQSQRMRKRKT